MAFQKFERRFISRVLIAAGILIALLWFLMGKFGFWQVLDYSRTVFEISIFLVLTITFIITIIMTRDIISPLREITRAASEMAEGNLDQKININSRDEIGILAQNLNLMAISLKEKILEITEEKNKIKAILSSMDEGVIAIDKKGSILLINPVVEKMFHTTYEDALGKNVIEIIRNYELELLIKKGLEKEEPIQYILPFLVPERRTFRVHLTPLKSSNSIVGIVVILRDITELRRLEQMRSQFVANVSHELRTPLTSIKGFVETLQDGAIEDKATANNFLKIIGEEAERLNRLINDVLSLSKIESKPAEIEKAPTNLAEVANNVVAMLRPLAHNKKISLSCAEKGTLPLIAADKDMIGQVFINLTENALKYTPEGGRVEIIMEPFNGGVRTEIRDTGFGIPEDSISRIFERFYRVDKARSREMGGTGLGLAIVKHIIEAHRGTITVTSQLNKGSVFTFTLPAE